MLRITLRVHGAAAWPFPRRASCPGGANGSVALGGRRTGAARRTVPCPVAVAADRSAERHPLRGGTTWDVKHATTADSERWFDVVLENDRAQAATMTLAPGDATGGPENAHADSDQWLYVVAGEGEAILGGRRSVWRPETCC
jgi:mannose-6-phosphate isomerase-like protein (cupin superfamily)